MINSSRFFILLLAGTFIVTSCIDESYDLENLDPEVTILPGISVPINSSTEVPLADILPADGNLIQLDEEDNYRMEFKSFGQERTSIPKVDFEYSSEFKLGNTLCMLRVDMPENIENFSISPRSPLALEIVNPTGEELLLNADFFKGSRFVHAITGILVPPGNSVITVTDNEIKDMLAPFDDDIFLDNITLSRLQPMAMGTAYEPETSTSDDDYYYDFYISSFIPLEFEAGKGIEFSYYSGIFDASGISDALNDMELEVKSMDIKARVINEFPMDINISATLLGDKTKISHDRTIAAGTVEKPVTTELTITASDLGKLDEIDRLMLKFSALVPDSCDSYVTLNGNQKITFEVDDVTLEDGFTFSLDD